MHMNVVSKKKSSYVYTAKFLKKYMTLNNFFFLNVFIQIETVALKAFGLPEAYDTVCTCVHATRPDVTFNSGMHACMH